MKRILLYLIGGIAFVCVFLLLLDDKNVEVTSENGDSIKREEEVDMMDKRKKVGEIISSKKKTIGFNNIDASISKKETNNGTSIIYELYNKGEQDINLLFPSSQEFDYEIYDENGTLIYRYSDEYVFSQVISEVLFSKGKTLTFVAGLPPLEKGEYKIIFWAAAKGLKGLKEELTLTVE